MINKVDIKVTQLLNDLSNGLTWLKRDNLGYGSIEEKYLANENQIGVIRKHPMLKDAETTAVIFNIIDDTKDTPGKDVHEKINDGTVSNESTENINSNVKSTPISMVTNSANMDKDAGDAFNNI